MDIYGMAFLQYWSVVIETGSGQVLIPPAPPPQPPPAVVSQGQGALSTHTVALIAGLLVAGACVALILVGAVYLWKRRQRRQRELYKASTTMGSTPLGDASSSTHPKCKTCSRPAVTLSLDGGVTSGSDSRDVGQYGGRDGGSAGAGTTTWDQRVSLSGSSLTTATNDWPAVSGRSPLWGGGGGAGVASPPGGVHVGGRGGFNEMAIADMAAAARRRLAQGSSISLMAGSKASFRLGLNRASQSPAPISDQTQRDSQASDSAQYNFSGNFPGNFPAESFVILGSSGRLLARQQSSGKKRQQAPSTARSPLGAVPSGVSDKGDAIAVAAGGIPPPQSPWGATAAAAALGLVSEEGSEGTSYGVANPAEATRQAEPRAEASLASPWGAALAATALGLDPDPVPEPGLAPMASPWGALLAAAALGHPSIEHQPSGSGQASTAEEGSRTLRAARPTAVTVPMVSELLLPFQYPNDAAPPTTMRSSNNGPNSASAFNRTPTSDPSSFASHAFSGAGAPLTPAFSGTGPSMIGELSMPGSASANTIRPYARLSNGQSSPYLSPPTSAGVGASSSTPFSVSAMDGPAFGRPSVASAFGSSTAVSMTGGASGSALQAKMTGRLATLEPDPSIRFELDWST